jgi:hypothetical protein
METMPCPYCNDAYDICALPEHAEQCERVMMAGVRANTAPPVRVVAQETRTIPCASCKNAVTMDDLFILDECCCKFHRDCIAKYVASEIVKSSNVTCPHCSKGVSMRDAKELLPSQTASVASPNAAPDKGE